MPAINVARTDTFEIQRQKINEIGAQIFNISAGGSDLATGLLKIGDGTRLVPSLSFTNDDKLGIYRPDANTFGFVSSTKNIIDFSNISIFSYRDFILRKRILSDVNISIADAGSGYSPGNYTNISLIGGSGELGTIDVVVTEYIGTILNSGKNYNPGSYSSINLIGGSGTGASADFAVDPLNGEITDGGSGYIPGQYAEISLINGSGSGAVANVTVTGDTVTSGTVTNVGTGYIDGIYGQISLRNVATATYTVTSVANVSPPPNSVYQINGVTQQTLTLTKGNTYRFDISDASVSGHPFSFQDASNNPLNFENYLINKVGSEGTAGSFIDLIILPSAATETIYYYCTAHPGMGASISVVNGSAGVYGSGGICSFEVISGQISNFTVIDQGNNYKVTDQLTIASFDVGAGSGFLYTITNILYSGTVSDITIVSSGQNYVFGDVLSASDADLGGGGGSGFLYTITSSPGIIRDFNFDFKGVGYQPGDTLTLPTGVSGITAEFITDITGLSVTLTSGSTIVTTSSTSGIQSGMSITVGIGSTGDLPPNVTVDQVTGPTSFTVSEAAVASGPATLDLSYQGNSQEITPSSLVGIAQGDFVTVTSGSGSIPPNTTVTNINELSGTITLSNSPLTGGPVTLSFLPSFGIGTEIFEFEIDSIGSVESVLINDPGNGYNVNDTLTVSPSDLVQPITYSVKTELIQVITFTSSVSSTFFSIGNFIDYDNAGFINSYEIVKVNTSGSNLVSLYVIGDTLESGNVVVKQGTLSPELTIDTVSNESRFFIDTGSGYDLTPNLTLYVGDTYVFDLSDSSNDSHQFALSEFRDGIHSPSLVENVSTTLSTSSNQITVASTTGIVAGMQIEKLSGDGEFLPGVLVESVDSQTQLTLSQTPTTSGVVILTFKGTEYTESVSRNAGSLEIKVLENTPSLYYYCNFSGSAHVNMGGDDNQESIITIDPNNPRTFGSGFEIIVNTITSDDQIKFDIISGEVEAISILSDEITTDNATIDSLTVTSGIITSLNTNVISSGSALTITPATNFSTNVNIGSTISFVASSGNITTPGIIRTNNSLNVNNALTIVNAQISSIGTNDLQLTAASGKLVKVTGNSAFVIPVGNSLERPTFIAGQGSGAIRFNTTTNQYEGYSQSSSSWASLGGVRDTDGNTYITAEESVTPTPTNDNRLWFYNDGVNTLRITSQYQEFMGMKKIRSLNTSLPAYTAWTANTPVVIGQYLKWRGSIYLVTASGTTATSGNEPSNVTGTPFTNGTATLQYYASAVSTLTFEEISQINIGPVESVPMVFGNDLRITKNTISTDVTDITLKPNTGRRIICDIKTHLQIPVGTEGEKSTGTAQVGSIRYNTTNQQYEGYIGNNRWGSLGGVKDVDGNTYIIPETGPGTNENILYFYNDNINTLQLTTTTLDFTNINTVSCSFDDSLEITASTVTFDNSSTTIDNTVADTTFIHTAKDKLDLGLSTGLTVDPLLRLNDQGDVYYNTGFGTGTQSLVRVFDKNLSNLEISKYRISTNSATLLKGTTNNGSAVIYNPSTELSAKVEFIAHNTTTGNKEIIEFSVIDKGSDIYYTEVGTIQTGSSLITYTFDFNVNNAVRLNYSLATGVANANVVNVTVVSNVIKK